MLGRSIGAKFVLEQLVTELARTDPAGAILGRAQAGLRAISALSFDVASGGAEALRALRERIAEIVASVEAIAVESRTAVAGAEAREASLHAHTLQTERKIRELAEELFERKVLDPYLRFGSPEEEVAYRAREAERKGYIARELAKGTPEGALNAANATVDQIDDAGAHGATESPDFLRLRDDAIRTRDGQRKAIVLADQSPNAVETRVPVTPPGEVGSLEEAMAAMRAAGVELPTDQLPSGPDPKLTSLQTARGTRTGITSSPA